MSQFEFYNIRGRMAQFRIWNNQPEDWEKRWGNSVQFALDRHRNGHLGEFEIFTRYLPQQIPILEAGCGMGHWVAALDARGYRIEGVDYSKNTIARIQKYAPNLSVRVGDVYNLESPDEYYGGYISIGVFEHNPDGPLAGLIEAHRVLSKKGVALICVPYLNPARQRLANRLPVTTSLELRNGFRFYQYYFSHSDFERCLDEAGFKVLEVYPYAVEAGLSRDFVVGRWMEGHSFFHWRIKSVFHHMCQKMPAWARWEWGHMLLFVCRPIG